MTFSPDNGSTHIELAAMGNVTASSAEFNGLGSCVDQAFSLYLEYGPTSEYGHVLDVLEIPRGLPVPIPYGRTIEDLAPTTTYYWRFVVGGADHFEVSATGSFTTPSGVQERGFVFGADQGIKGSWHGEVSPIEIPASARIVRVLFSVPSPWTLSGSELTFDSVAVGGNYTPNVYTLYNFNNLNPQGSWHLTGVATSSAA